MGKVEIRLNGQAADVEELATLLAAAGWDVGPWSRPYPNRKDDGVRVYGSADRESEGQEGKGRL